MTQTRPLGRDAASAERRGVDDRCRGRRGGGHRRRVESTAADGLDTAASALHDRADDLPGGETVREFAHATADRLSTSADYVRSHDATRMMADVETFVKSNPGPALAGRRRVRIPPRSSAVSRLEVRARER